MLSFLLSVLAGMSFSVLSAGDQNKFPPPLEKKEENELFERYIKTGDMTAREKLIEHNLRLAAHIVKKYYSGNPQQEDLLSIGTIGLIKAVDSYNPENGARFATYGAKCIQNEILMYFRSQKKLAMEVSMEETIDIDKEGNPLTYTDIIKCDDTIAEDLDKKIKITKASEYIMKGLSEREREILILRYGLGNHAPVTQREAAVRLGISRSYVSRIEKNALEKIRKIL